MIFFIIASSKQIKKGSIILEEIKKQLHASLSYPNVSKITGRVFMEEIRILFIFY